MLKVLEDHHIVFSLDEWRQTKEQIDNLFVSSAFHSAGV